jgi:toluene monooxygenase electron transfer component
MNYKIKVSTSDVVFDSDSEDTLLRGALRAGIEFPYECNSGGCGSCKFELISGEIDELWPEAHGLSARDIRKGKKLACQCKPRSDCEIKTHITHQCSDVIPQPKRTKLNFVGKSMLTSDMAEFAFHANEPAEFLAGQFALFTLPGVEGDRAYSMSNVANEQGEWRFIIKNMPEGKGSAFMFNRLAVGDRLDVDGPYGLAYLRNEPKRDIICIGGGSGLSPIVSIVNGIDADSNYNNTQVHMFYGGRSPSDICTPEVFKNLKNIGDNLTLYSATSDPKLSAEQGWEGEVCFIHELVEQKFGADMPNYEFYFCGPPPMTQAIQRMLMLDHQVPFEQLHFDRFF